MSKTKILIVEDESLIALEIETRLKKLGYDVCGKAVNSDQAFELVELHKPDLILMDIMIKGRFDGIETVVEINKKRSIPIVYLTAYTDQKTLDRAKNTDPFGYLSKPIQERDLRTTIEMAIHKSQIDLQLKEATKWLQTTLASIGDGVIATDSDGNIQFLNQVAEIMTGWTQAEAIQKKLNEVFVIQNEETGQTIDSLFESVIKAGEKTNLENHTVLISKQGNKKSIINSAAPIKDENGNIQGVVLVFHDESERKQAQKELLRESNFRKLIIDFAAEGVFVFSGLNKFPNITFTMWNNRMTEITGFSVEEVNNGGFDNFLSSARLQKPIEEILNILQSGERLLNYDLEFINKFGEKKQVSLTATFITQANDDPVVVGMIADHTEKKRIEQQIILLAHTIRNISDSVTVTDLDNNLIYVNEGFERTYGYTSEEVIGKNISIISLASEELLEEVRADTIKGGWQGEILNKRKDGTVFPISLSTSIIYDNDNKILGLVGVTKDITESKLAEEKIRQSEKDYRGLFESAHDAILIFQPEDEIVLEVNQRACDMYLISKEEFIGMSLEKISCNVEKGKEHIHNTLGEKGQYIFESKQKKKDGTIIDLEISASVINYKNKQAILSINRDITDRKLAEQTIRESEERYRSLFETMEQGVVYHSSDGKIFSVNPAAEYILGLSSDQLVGKKSFDIFSKALQEDGTPFLEDQFPSQIALQTKKPVTGTVMGIFNPTISSYNWILIDAIPQFQQGENEPNSVFTTFSNISEIRRAEKIQKVLFHISEASNSSVEFDALFSMIHDSVKNLIFANNFYIALYDVKTGILSFPYFVDEFEAIPDPRRLGNELIDQVIKTGKSISISNRLFNQKSSSNKYESHKRNVNYWLGVPLKVENEIIGAMVIQSYSDTRQYKDEDEIFLTTISNQVALAIQRKKYSDAVRQSELKYRAIFDNSPIGIYQSDLSGKLITVNKSFINMLGYKSAEEMLTVNMNGLYLSSEDRDKIFAQIRVRGSISESEILWRKKNGEKIWVELNSNVVYDDGSFTIIEGFVKDVTQRKKDEIIIKESVQRYSSMFDNNHAVMLIIDPTDGSFADVNPAACKYYGYSRDTLMKMKIREINVLEYSEIKNEMQNALNFKKNLFLFKHKLASGEIRDVQVFSGPINFQDKTYLYSVVFDVTEKLQAEREVKKYQEHLELMIEQRTEELRISEEKFRALAENSDDTIIRFNPSLQHVYVNPAVSFVTGITSEEFLGKTHRELNFPSNLVEIFESSLKKVFKEKLRNRVEYMLPNGVWIDWLLIPEINKKGNVVSVITSGRDITARKKVEQELYKRDKLLRGVAAASNKLFALDGFDPRIHATLELIGNAADVDRVYIFENFRDSSTGDLMTSQKYEWNSIYASSELDNPVLQNLSYVEFGVEEWMIQLSQGKPVNTIVRELPDELKELLEAQLILSVMFVPIEVFGKFWGFIGFDDCRVERIWSESEKAILSTLASDIGGAITRKIVEHELKSSEERFKILFDFAPESYFLINHDGFFVDANQEAEKTVGYTKSEVINNADLQLKLFPKKSRIYLLRLLARSKQGIPTGPDELEVIRKDGKSVFVEMNTYPVEIDGKKLVLGAAHDISLRKKAEEEIRRALIHSQELNQMKSRFVSMVSHEFRTPLSTMLSSLELLELYEDRLTKDDKTSHFKKMMHSIDYLTELLNDVITINRADAGKLTVNYDYHESVAFVKQLIADLQNSYNETPELIFSPANNKIEIRTDEKLFRQIVSNLISNAIKYTPQHKSVFINLKVDNDFLILEIIDQGVGIPETSQRELFTPFYRASNIGNVPGSGLGLAITKRSIELLKGEIFFTSKENSGSTFIVKLPIKGDFA